MAERNIQGKDVLLLKRVGSSSPYTWIPVVCLTGNPVGRSRNINTDQTKCGAITTTDDPIYTVTATGTIVWGNDGTLKVGHTDLVALFGTAGATQTIGHWRIAPAVPVTGDNVIEFDGTVSALNDTFPTSGSATFDLTLAPNATTWTETVAA